MSILSERLKKLRLENNIKSKDLAQTLDVEPATITNWEKGTRIPRESKLVMLADFFDCSTDYLLGRTDNPGCIVYNGTIANQPAEIEVDKNYPYNLTPEDVANIFKQLESVGLDINKLIEKSKSNSENNNG